MKPLTYDDIANCDDPTEPTYNAELVREYWRQQQEQLRAYEQLKQQRDAEWQDWYLTDAAVFDIIKDPDLAIKPSERPTPLKKLIQGLKK